MTRIWLCFKAQAGQQANQAVLMKPAQIMILVNKMMFTTTDPQTTIMEIGQKTVPYGIPSIVQDQHA